MPFMKPNSPFLFDDITNDIVGVKDPDGSETFFTKAQRDANGNTTAILNDDGSVALTLKTSGLSLDSAAATINTKIIQAALDTFKSVVIDVNGPIYTNDTFVQREGSSIVTAKGTYFKQANGVNKKMIVNEGYLRAATTVTITWSSGNTATMNWPSHGLALRDAVVLQGSTQKDWDAVVRVVSVTDANNVEILLPWFPAAAPSGTVTAKRCDRNIYTDIRTDYNYTNNTTATGQDRMNAIYAFIADSHVEVKSFDVFKYVLLVAGAENVTGGGKNVPYGRSDTVKLYGPANNVRLYAEGIAGEDTASFQALEPAAFIAYMPCMGRIQNCKLENAVGTVTTSGTGAIVVYSDDTYTQSGIVIENGNLSATGSNNAFRLLPGSGFSVASSKLKDVTVKGGTLTSKATSTACAMISTSAEIVRFDGVTFNPPAADLTGRWVSVINNSVVDLLAFENTDFDLSTRYPSAGVYGVEVQNGSTVNAVLFKKCKIKGSTFYRLFLANGTSVVKFVIFEDCDMYQMSSIARLEVAGVTVIIRGGRYIDSPALANFRNNGNIIIEGSPEIVNSNLGLIRAELTAVVNVYADSAPRLSGTSVLFTALNTATLNIKSDSISVDIGATGIAKAVGNRAFNTSARGTIPANVPVVCDGTNWYNQCNLAQTF